MDEFILYHTKLFSFGYEQYFKKLENTSVPCKKTKVSSGNQSEINTKYPITWDVNSFHTS